MHYAMQNQIHKTLQQSNGWHKKSWQKCTAILSHHIEDDKLEMLSIPCNHAGLYSAGLDSSDLNVGAQYLTTVTTIHPQICSLLIVV